MGDKSHTQGGLPCRVLWSEDTHAALRTLIARNESYWRNPHLRRGCVGEARLIKRGQFLVFPGQKEPARRCGNERPSTTRRGKNGKKTTTSDPPPVPQNNSGTYLLEAAKRTLRRGQWELPHGEARRGATWSVAARCCAVEVAHTRGGDDARTSRALMSRRSPQV